ncbi:MAG: ABC transporter permease [Rhodospirillales bacterium]|nr:ABC transporter permease [Rhodospirillales bacterium]
MGRSFYLARFELRRYLAHRSDLAFGIALPVVLFSLMMVALGSDAKFRGVMHVADLDGGSLASQVLERVENADGVTVRRYTQDELADALERTAISTGFVIPPGFSASVEFGVPASIVVKSRGSGGDEGRFVTGIVQGALRAAASEIELRRVAGVLAGDPANDARLDEAVRQALAGARTRPPVTVVTESMRLREASQLDRLLAGIVVMFLLFSGTLGARALIEERRTGTLERLMTTRLSAGELFAGKLLAGIGRVVLQSFVLLGLAFAVLGTAGPVVFLQCLVLAIVVAAAVTSIGLVIAAVARTEEQAAFSAVVLTMFMSVFGGTFLPTSGTGWLDVLARFTLNKYATDAFVGLFGEAATLADQSAELVILGAVAILGLAAARMMFRVSSSAV